MGRSLAARSIGVVLLAGCFSDRPTTAPPVADVSDLRIVQFAYQPPAVTVSAGTTGAWTNDDATIHTVTADNGAFDSGTFNQGKTFRLDALAPGTYTYFCRIHPFMKGTLTVAP